MKRWKKVVLLVLLVVLLALAALCMWERQNLKAVYLFLTRDSDSIAAAVEENRENHRKELEDTTQFEITVQAPSSEQNNAILDGTKTGEEVKQELGLLPIEPKPEKPDLPLDSGGNTGGEETNPPVTTPPASTPPAGGGTQSPAADPEPTPALTAQDLVNQCIAEMYACEVDVMVTLGQMKEEVETAWAALQPSERNKTRKLEFVTAGLQDCYDLEVEVDARITEILDRYRAALKEIGADTAVMDMLWKQYCEEKETQKAYYMDIYVN